MRDKYRNYSELAQHEKECLDYHIEFKPRDSRILIMAPHGGKIESFTTELAKGIANSDFSYYSFIGIKKKNNRDLHITSHRFDEPNAVDGTKRADIVIAIHGNNCATKEFIMIGGLHKNLCKKLKRELLDKGFICLKPTKLLMAQCKNNICNKGRFSKGVQLELSEKLRKKLASCAELKRIFVDTLREALHEVE